MQVLLARDDRDEGGAVCHVIERVRTSRRSRGAGLHDRLSLRLSMPGDRSGDDFRVLMFPEPQHPPARGAELRVGLLVPLDVALQLWQPVGPVPLGDRRVQRASVPEAAIDEHGDAASCECDVGSTSPAHRREFDAISKPHRMKSPAHGEFRRCIASAFGAHGSPRSFAGRPGLWRNRSRTLDESTWAPLHWVA